MPSRRKRSAPTDSSTIQIDGTRGTRVPRAARHSALAPTARGRKGEHLLEGSSQYPLPLAGSPPPESQEPFTFIDLFAGIGGFRLGFEDVGGTCVFTSERDSHARTTYRANFGNDAINEDITSIVDPSSEIPDHDVLLAGFPCQPFSLAGVSKKNSLGQKHGFECETQGTLFFHIARILDAKRPRAFVLENVKNLLSHDNRRTFKIIERTLKEQLGYRVTYNIVDAARFLPQHRERLFIVGLRPDVSKRSFEWEHVILPPKERGPKLSSILHTEDGSEDVEPSYLDKEGRVLNKYILTRKLWHYLQDYARRHREKGNGFGYGLVTRNDIARTLSARYYKDGAEILISRGTRSLPRRLTPRECARLMGFDRPGHEPYRIVASDTQAYRQFGNAVAVPVVAAIARVLKNYLPLSVTTNEKTPRAIGAA